MPKKKERDEGEGTEMPPGAVKGSDRKKSLLRKKRGLERAVKKNKGGRILLDNRAWGGQREEKEGFGGDWNRWKKKRSEKTKWGHIA